LETQKILIVDDEEDIRNLLTLVLRDRGFSVTSVSNGQEALEEITREKPSLLILDLLMPQISGDEVCRIIKEDPGTRDIFIMILTARDDLQSKIECLNMGAEEYLIKPIDIEELVARVNRILSMIRRWQGRDVVDLPIAAADSGSDATWVIHEKTQPTVHASPDASSEDVAVIVDSTPQTQFTKDFRKDHKPSYGAYRVESLAGIGGMGQVYKAYDAGLDRYVAVKVLSKEWSSSPEFLNQFHREAKLIASINHPRIAPIYTFGEQDGESYFALQWCSGGSMANLIRQRGTIDLMQAIDFILQCARGLEAASQKGVVHRDIKPSNLMFDENQYIKIVDFGVAFNQNLTEKTAESQPVVGSPAYMAPEQGRGAQTDQRTDVYSLGISFYQMLYGRLPFSAKSPWEWVAAHVEQPFPPYNDLGGKIPAKAYQIIQKMTQKNPDGRYANYPELIRDLEHLRSYLYSQRNLKIPVADTEGMPVLQGDNLFDLLSDIFQKERNGVLKVSWGRLQKSFLILRNEIVSFESPQSDENPWNVLVKRNLMKEELLPPSTESLEESLNRLLSIGACDPEDFKAIYREMITQSMLQVFLWPTFEGKFFQARIKNEPFAMISLPAILMEAARSVPYDSFKNKIPFTHSIVRTPKFDRILTKLSLAKGDHFLASRLDGENVTAENLQWLTGFSQEQVLRAVYAWEKMGALEYREPSQRKVRQIKEPAVEDASLPPVIKEVTRPAPKQTPPSAAGKKERIQTPVPRVDPELAEKYYDIAQVNYKAAKYWEVERNCVRAIKSNPAEAKYHYLLALALTHYSHSMQAAEESFRQAIRLDPNHLECRYDLATFLKDQGRWDDAINECDRILDLSPKDSRVLQLRGQILKKSTL
jgi:serine/threonine protein kinase/ActR/RegA family two-component response regulator